MISLSGFAARLRRSRRMDAYRKLRAKFETMSEADLADMGLKRYQLGPAARAKALR